MPKSSTANLEPLQQQRNSQADAFRHAYWNALITHEFGYDYALAFTMAHETDPSAERPEQFMDLHNNEVGRQIALANPEMRPEHIQQEILKALRNGDLYVWDGKDIYFSNQCPSCMGSGY